VTIGPAKQHYAGAQRGPKKLKGADKAPFLKEHTPKNASFVSLFAVQKGAAGFA
jgi:hypothetical protein